MGEKRNAYSVLMGKPEGMRPPDRQRHRLEENIKMDLKEIQRCGLDSCDSQAQLVGCYEHSNEPFSSTRGRELLH
jgi:hypothetical protein